jgi:hypothetical protein
MTPRAVMAPPGPAQNAPPPGAAIVPGSIQDVTAQYSGGAAPAAPPTPATPPPATMNQDQMMALMQAMQPGSSWNGTNLISRQVNQPATAAFAAGLPVEGGTMLSQESNTAMDPRSIAQRLAVGGLAPTEEQKALAFKYYDDINKSMTALQHQQSEAALGKGRLGLDTQTQLGNLGVSQGRLTLDQQKEAFERQKFEEGKGEDSIVRNLAATLAGQGVEGPKIQAAIDTLRPFLKGAKATTPLTATPVATPTSPGNLPGPPTPPTPTPPTPTPNTATKANLYDPIVTELDKFANTGAPTKAGGQATQQPIGKFLNDLDAAKPGFVRQNWPAIQSYIKTKYGESAFQDAASPAQYVDPFDVAAVGLPAVANLTRWGSGMLGLTPRSNLADQSLPSWAGGWGTLMKLMRGDTTIGGTPTDEALGRSKLRNLMGGR